MHNLHLVSNLYDEIWWGEMERGLSLARHYKDKQTVGKLSFFWLKATITSNTLSKFFTAKIFISEF